MHETLFRFRTTRFFFRLAAEQVFLHSSHLNPSKTWQVLMFFFHRENSPKKNTEEPTLIYSNESCSTAMIFFSSLRHFFLSPLFELMLNMVKGQTYRLSRLDHFILFIPWNYCDDSRLCEL